MLWAERQLALLGFIRVCMNVLSDFLPEFYLGKAGQYTFARRIRWGCMNFIRNFFVQFSDGRKLAKVYAIRDYIFRRFGDCPQQVRELNVSDRQYQS